VIIKKSTAENNQSSSGVLSEQLVEIELKESLEMAVEDFEKKWQERN
jgi:hypothetical protein